jgi:hypothetical protein
MNRTKRLKEWIKTLSEEQKDKILLDLVGYAIDSEYVNFYETTEAPYYDGDGERLDGIEWEG